MRSRWYVPALLLFVVVAAGGFFASQRWRGTQPPDLATGTLFAPRRALPDFSLIDHRGQAFTPASLRGHWSLLFFGYTNCPDVCPTTLTTLAALAKRLRADSGAVDPQVVFVSVDAARDTPQQLSRYVPYFDPQFIGVSAANQRDIESFAARMGVVVMINRQSDGAYTVDHSAALFVVDPEGRLAAVLTGPYTVDALQADLRQITAARS